MKVLWIAPVPVSNDQMHPAPWITSWARLLIDKQVEVTILTTYKSSSASELELDTYYGKVVAVPVTGGITNLLSLYNQKINKLSNYIKKNAGQYDVVHIHGTEHQYYTALSRSKVSLPSVVSVQGVICSYINYLPVGFSSKKIYWSLFSMYEKQELKKARNFFCRTNWDKGIVKQYNRSANIIDLWEIMRPEFYNGQHTISPDKNDIFFPGGANELKGLDIALKTLSLIKQQYPNTRLHIIGGCAPAYVTQLLAKNNITNIEAGDYVVHGKVDASQIISIYQHCFCLLHTSLIDNSPNSVCEAQVYGMPVIATAVGGVPSLIEEGVTGILTSLDPTAIAAKVIALKKDEQQQAAISKASMKMSRERHNPDTIVNTTLLTYTKLITANGKVNQGIV
jgi:glycosyltransferase involved in cell wall biosynthesis